MDEVTARLEELRRGGLHRKLRLVEGPQGPRVTLDGSEVLLLCSNNYLGLADHPRVRQGAAEAAERYGAGAGASRLICGDMELHRKLEMRLAEFEGTQAALLFGSGYLANTGIVSALAGEGGVVFSDELNHASIIDGCRLARSETHVYRHADLDDLEAGLRHARGKPCVIVTDSVFSMDGDVAPLVGIHELAKRYGAKLVVDEAHATGTLGPGGRGAVAAAGLTGQVDVVVGTLGKSLGSYGAYACTSVELRDYLINTARPFIFSTAPPPPSLGAALAALDLLDKRPGVVEQLRRNGAVLREALSAEGLDVGLSRTQIVPVIVGSARLAMALCERVLDGGTFAQAIRPPTVPEGTARLRLTVMANHRADELQRAAHQIGRAARDLGIIPASRAEFPRAA